MNICIFSGLLTPGASSTPLETSTPKGLIALITEQTFSGSSGVEKDGGKDFGLMKAFIDAVKNC